VLVVRGLGGTDTGSARLTWVSSTIARTTTGSAGCRAQAAGWWGSTDGADPPCLCAWQHGWQSGMSRRHTRGLVRAGEARLPSAAGDRLSAEPHGKLLSPVQRWLRVVRGRATRVNCEGNQAPHSGGPFPLLHRGSLVQVAGPSIDAGSPRSTVLPLCDDPAQGHAQIHRTVFLLDHPSLIPQKGRRARPASGHGRCPLPGVPVAGSAKGVGPAFAAPSRGRSRSRWRPMAGPSKDTGQPYPRRRPRVNPLNANR